MEQLKQPWPKIHIYRSFNYNFGYWDLCFEILVNGRHWRLNNKFKALDRNPYDLKIHLRYCINRLKEDVNRYYSGQFSDDLSEKSPR